MKYVNKVFWSVVATLFLVALGVSLPIAVVLGIICGVGFDGLEAKLRAIGEEHRNGKAASPVVQANASTGDPGIDEILQIHDDVEREAIAYKVSAYAEAFDRMSKSKPN